MNNSIFNPTLVSQCFPILWGYEKEISRSNAPKPPFLGPWLPNLNLKKKKSKNHLFIFLRFFPALKFQDLKIKLRSVVAPFSVPPPSMLNGTLIHLIQLTYILQRGHTWSYFSDGFNINSWIYLSENTVGQYITEENTLSYCISFQLGVKLHHIMTFKLRRSRLYLKNSRTIT